MKNFKLTIAYDGSRYKGWQKQKNTDLTIQGKIEAVLSRMTGEEIAVIGCGRTDAGVHAENYIANFHTGADFLPQEIQAYAYEYLPEDIVIKAVEEVPERFHARYNVKAKTYVYRINNHQHRDVFKRKYEYHLGEKLDLDEMKKAAAILTGSHDFQSFTNEKGNKSTERTINYIRVLEKDGIIVIVLNGNGFLWNMVRIIVGTLMEVGKGELSPVEVEKILQEKKRWEAGPMAQAKGLCLREVQY